MFIGYVFMTAFGVSLLLYRYVMAINISAWASALLVLTGWAMRRPQSVGRVTVTDSRAFYLCLFESKNEEANRIVQSVAQSLGLSKDDVASIVLNSMNNDPEQEIDKIMHGLSEIQDKNLVSELYSKSMRLAEISGDRETVGFVKRVFEELR